jgi:hypothetical protein
MRYLVWALASLAYLIVSPYQAVVGNPDEDAAVRITSVIAARHMVPARAPAVSFVGAPIWAAEAGARRLVGWPPPSARRSTFWLRLIVVKLPLCAFLCFFARHVGGVSREPVGRDLAVVALALGTPLYGAGQFFVGQALAAAAAFAAYALIKGPSEGPFDPPRTSAVGRSPSALTRLMSEAAGQGRRLALAGFWTGLAVVFEHKAFLVAAALAVYAAVRSGRRALPFFLGALPAAVVLGRSSVGVTLPKISAVGSLMFSADLGSLPFSPVLAAGAAAALWLVARRESRADGVLAIAVCLLGPRSTVIGAPFLLAALARVWPLVGGRLVSSALVAGLVIPSVLLNVVTGALFPLDPSAFDNPAFDLAFPLLGTGHAPYSLGWLLGLRGLASLAPLAIVLLVALARGVAGPDPRPRRWLAHGGIAIAVAAALLVGLSGYGRAPRADETQLAAAIRTHWEPR